VTTVTGIDHSTVGALSDDELAAALALFAAELARREALAPEDIECTEPRCREAYSHPIQCRCSSGGRFHSIDRMSSGVMPSPVPRGAAGFEARLGRHGGDVFALMGVDDEDELPARNRNLAAALDEDDYF
jgi:hypothetical protein